MVPSGAEHPAQPAPAGTQAIQRAAGILKQIGRSGARGACMAELCRDLSIERPTLHRILCCLLSEGLVGRNPRTKRYYLGRALYDLGQVAAPRFGLREICAATLTRLAEQTGDTVFLAGLDGADGVVIDRRDSPAPMRAMPLQIGMRRPLGVGASGLAMLMALEDGEVMHLLSDNAPRLRHYNVRPVSLLNSLHKFRNRGYAVSRGYSFPELCGIGMPLMGPQGRPCGAISVTAPSPRMTPQHQRDVLAALQDGLAQIDLRLRGAAL